MSFDISTAVAVNNSDQGVKPKGGFDINTARAVESNDKGETPYDAFRGSTSKEQVNTGNPGKDASKVPPSPKETKPKDVSHETVKGPTEYPDEGLLNSFVHQLEGQAWKTIAKPVLGMKDPDMDKYLSDLDKHHPISAALTGTAPYIATAPLFPEGLIGVSANFAAVSGITAIGKARTEDALKPIGNKILDIAEETAKGASFGPIWHYSAPLGWVGRALTRGTGSATLSAIYGDNITEAFKQGGMITALSLVFENPALSKTALGRGVIEKANKDIYESMFGGEIASRMAQGQKPTKIDPTANPDVMKKSILDVVGSMAKRVFPGPKIVAATIQLPDGTQIHGASHEDALNKIGSSEEISKEGVDHTSGFTVMDPNGKTRFITREESKEKPFSLPNGSSQDVKGLNESKFMKESEQTKVVNPSTLEQIKGLHGEEGAMDVNMIPGVAEAAEILQRTHTELKEKMAPYTVGEEGKFTAATLRENLGIMARNHDMLENALSASKKIFDKADKDSSLDFINKMEAGEKQTDPNLEKVARTLRTMLDTKRDEIRALGTGKLENFIENYFPHIWESPNQAKDVIKAIMGGRRPFEGNKSFLKKRKIPTMKEGIDAGLTPVTYNPIDSAMLKVREMDRYLMAQRTKQALNLQGIRRFVRVGEKAPDGWKKVNDNSEDVYKSPMIAIQEAYDEHVMTKLNDVAKNLGIDLERSVKLRGRELGSSRRGVEAPDDPIDIITGKANPGKVRTKFASPESVLAHEIGHQIDEMYGLKQMFLSDRNTMVLDNLIEKTKKNEAMSDEERKDAIKNLKFEKKINKEFQDLADARFEGKDATKGFRQYVRKGSEKMAVMLEAYIHAPDKFKEKAPNVFKSFDNLIKTTPKLAPLAEIKPSLVLGTNEGEVYAGGNVISGSYYTQPDAARILNNYLSPGLAGKSYIYDMYRGAGNTLNQFQLGFTAFHLGFTSMETTVGKTALGINKLSTGDYAGAIKEFSKAPFAPITNILSGDKLYKAWLGKDEGTLYNTVAEVMASAGGRAKMDKFYATGAKESMQKALKEGKILTGALKVPYYIVEQVARPIMEYVVPRQKMGIFMDMMKMEMERNPSMTHEQMRGVAQRAWDSVDNRMGQVVYDNLFWNRTTKDLAMASVRSLGWNLGTIRELGGGTKDVIGNVQDLIHGRGTKMSYRTAYVMALPIVTGLYGAIYQYLHTGQGPQELKDYFFPRNGAIDTKGQEARVSLPTYMKDIYHYTQNPVQTVLNKFSPVNNAVIEMIANKDFYGTEIRNADDSFMQQVLDESKFLGTQFLPFGFRNQKRDTRTSVGAKVEPFIGITPAPYDINMTKAEREASELNKGHIPVGSRTKEQAKHSQDKSKLRSDFMATKEIGPLNQAVEAKTITPKEKREIIKESKMSNIERLTSHSTAEEVERVMKKATPEERPILERILQKKREGKKQRGTWTQAEEEMYAKSFEPKE